MLLSWKPNITSQLFTSTAADSSDNVKVAKVMFYHKNGLILTVMFLQSIICDYLRTQVKLVLEGTTLSSHY